MSHKLISTGRLKLPDKFKQIVELTVAFIAVIALILIALGPLTGRFKPLSLYTPAFVVVILTLAYIAKSRSELRHKLLLLEEITLPCNPWLGADRTIVSMMEKLRNLYKADCCILIASEDKSETYGLRRVDRNGWEKSLRPEAISEELRLQLSGLTSTVAITYSRGWQGFWVARKRYCEIEVTEDFSGPRAGKEGADRIATIFEAESFLAVPVYTHNGFAGQIYLASERRNAFRRADARHIYQLLTRMLAIVEYIRRTEDLVKEAAERERKIVACDVHDSVIQPFIGIQLVLAAMKKRIQGGEQNVQNELLSLERIIDGEISGLRNYVAALNGRGITSSSLIELLRNFAKNVSEASGIAIEVRNGSQMRIDDKLAQETFQMVAEGLSNIRRHSNASRATVEVACDRDNLVIEIEDEGPEQEREPFTPQSLMTRARAFGGDLKVQQTARGSEITIKIPL